MERMGELKEEAELGSTACNLIGFLKKAGEHPIDNSGLAA